MTWSLRHERLLASLVRKYGAEAVAAKAQTVHHRGPGRPPRGGPARPGDRPYFYRTWLADTIDERAEEYREAGSRTPFKDAETEFYEFSFSPDDRRRHTAEFVERWVKRIKKQRLQGRQEARQRRARIAAYERTFSN